MTTVLVNHPVASLPGQAGGSGPSPALWGAVTPNMHPHDYIKDDFRCFDGLVASNVGRYASEGGAYRSYEDTGCSIAALATNHRGVIRVTTSGTDNHEATLQAGNATGVCARFTDTAGSREKVLFETRVAFTSVANTILGVFVGLAEETRAVADGVITDAGALADIDLIGFFRAEGDGDDLDIVLQKSGGGLITVLANALASDALSPISALTAGEFVKLGFRYNYHHQDGPRIEFFVNGVKLQTVYELTNGAFVATFPDGEELAPIWSCKNAVAGASSFDIDRWDLYQERLD